MKIEIIKDYIKQDDYKNKVFADYLKDNLDDTISFILTCSRDELIKTLYVLKSVALYFNSDYIVEIAKNRAKELSISRPKIFYNEIHELLKDYNAEFRLIKSIVDAIDPLGLIKKNDKLYSYDNQIKNICEHPILLDLDNKLNRIFNNANKEVLLKLSEQIKTSLKDGSLEKFIEYKQKYVIYYFEKTDHIIGAIDINIYDKSCEYFECSDQSLGGCDEEGNDYLEIDTSELIVKLLCNELLSTSYDLNNCQYINYYDQFETFSTYKNGKCHKLTIDASKKRYIYDVDEISYYDCFLKQNEFIFDAIFNGIKRLGFKELVLKEDNNNETK